MSHPCRPPCTAGKKIDETKLKKASEDLRPYSSINSCNPCVGRFFEIQTPGGRPGKEVYQSLFDREISKKMAQKGALGVGKIIYRK